MACNHPPSYSVLDPATLDRSVFIPFNSTFCKNASDVPERVADQYRQRKFPARCDLVGDVSMELAKRLVYLFYTRYRSEEMWRPEYAPALPARIRFERDVHLSEFALFRDYLKFFVRPAGNVVLHSSSRPMFRFSVQRRLLAACDTIRSAYRNWLASDGNAVYAATAWDRLPVDLRQDFHTRGSPGWVRCQSVHLFRYTMLNGGKTAASHLKTVQATDVALNANDDLSVPFVSWQLVSQIFERQRRKGSRIPDPSAKVTLPSAANAEDAEEGGDGEDAKKSHGGGGGGPGYGRRLRLDPTLIQGTTPADSQRMGGGG